MTDVQPISPAAAISGKAQLIEWAPILLGLAVLFIPTYWRLGSTIWVTDEQGHGPIILGLALWYIAQQRSLIHALIPNPRKALGIGFFSLGLLAYCLGRSQDILLLEVGAQIPVLMGLLLIARGWAAVKILWFPLFFLIFMVPLPGGLVDALTMPMKIAVSWGAEHILYYFDYPVSRSGVILAVGQYKLLVADACAGLHTLFTLEALGLLYLHWVKHESYFRNITLAILIVPISYTANTIRVIILCLVTFYYGDEAGQGFIHGFAGMVLFLTALIFIIGVDSTLQFFAKRFGAAKS
ncbi:MAG: exosortase B [Marinagarivorans sp.]